MNALTVLYQTNVASGPIVTLSGDGGGTVQLEAGCMEVVHTLLMICSMEIADIHNENQ